MHECSTLQSPLRRVRAQKRGQPSRKEPLCALVALLALSAGCKIGSEKKAPKQSSFDALQTQGPGFDLQDLKSLSGQLVRVARSSEASGATAGHAVLVSDSLALAPGLGCGDSGLTLQFAAQGNEPVRSPEAITSETRVVNSCESLRARLDTKIAESGAGGLAIWTALKSLLDRESGFKLALLSFEGGFPSTGPSWSKATAHESLSGTDSPSAEGYWGGVAERFVSLAGFSRDETSEKGTFSRRIWFPMRAKGLANGQDPFVGTLETWIASRERSPISSMDSWLQGPGKGLLPGIVFSGVSRFPNVRPFSEIESPDPKVLCFVIDWTENGEAPEELRFSARCLDAAPVFSVLE